MHRMIWVLITAMTALALSAYTASAIEYDVAQPVQKFSGKGQLLETGNDHGIQFRSYLESKQLLVKADGIYYTGVERVDGVDGAPNGSLRWKYEARCAVRPDLKTSIRPGVSVYNSSSPQPQFIDISENVTGATRGWFVLWWAVCRNQIKKFD